MFVYIYVFILKYINAFILKYINAYVFILNAYKISLQLV